MNDKERMDELRKYWVDNEDCDDYHYFLEGLRDIVEKILDQ